MTDRRFKSIKIFDGLYLYQDLKNSPYYQVRVRLPLKQKHKVISSRTDSLFEAKEFAMSYYRKLNSDGDLDKVPLETTLKYWCQKYLKSIEKSKDRTRVSLKTDETRLLSQGSGLCSRIGNIDVSKISNEYLLNFFEKRNEQLKFDGKDPLSASTKNKYLSLLKSVLRYALLEGAIPRIPDLITYKNKSKDNPRPSFRFDDKNNEYKRLLSSVRVCIQNQEKVRYNVITEDLYDVILFLVHGFVRPTVSELFSLRFKDLKVLQEDGIKTVQIQVNRGKTGFRISNSTEYLVDRVDAIKDRNPNYKDDDYIFLPQFKNRKTVSTIFQKQFQHVIERNGLEFDEFGQKRSLYSCRHLAIQMRLVNSGGRINILWFAKNCGTSVEMIERFYAKYLPNSNEVIKNLQTFSSKN